MTWRRKKLLGADTVRAILPDDREVVWSILGEYHPADMEGEVQTILGIPEGIYWVLFEECEQPYKSEVLS